MDWEDSRNFNILYILDGDGHLHAGTDTFRLKKGSVAVVPKGARYRIADSQGTPLSLYLLGFNNPEIETWYRKINIRTSRLTTHRLVCGLIQKLIRDILYELNVKRPGWDILTISKTLEILGLLYRCWQEHAASAPSVSSASSLSRVRVSAHAKDLSEHFYRHQSLEQAAASSGLHVRRFSSLFREVTGLPWLSFLRRKRIDYAKRLLADTDRSVISISFECGFEELSTFYRAFRQLENISPLAWRANAREALKAHPESARRAVESNSR